MGQEFKIGDEVCCVAGAFHDGELCFCTVTKTTLSQVYGPWHKAGEEPGDRVGWIEIENVRHVEPKKLGLTATEAKELEDAEIDAAWDSIGDFWNNKPAGAEPVFTSPIDKGTWPGAGTHENIGDYMPGPACEDEICADEFHQANEEIKALKEALKEAKEDLWKQDQHLAATRKITRESVEEVNLMKQEIETLKMLHAKEIETLKAAHAEEIRQLSAISEGMF